MKLTNLILLGGMLAMSSGLKAHPESILSALVAKCRSQQGYHPIDERPLMARQISEDRDTVAVKVPTLAEDPLAFARYFWAYELTFFDKK